jgi:ribonuclease HII
MNFKYENKKNLEGYTQIIGCDEVGRGCLAGPVVAAAVVLTANNKLKSKDIKDSKLLSVAKREELAENIKTYALAWSIGEVSQEVIDKINIHNATLLAMRRAFEGLAINVCSVIPSASEGSLQPSAALSRDDTKGVMIAIDGKFTIPEMNNNIKQEAIVDGDNKIISIAAASIIAKVYRDELMQKLDKKYPIYNFARHKGYATLFHRTMILQNGLSPIHRKTFCKKLEI